MEEHEAAGDETAESLIPIFMTDSPDSPDEDELVVRVEGVPSGQSFTTVKITELLI